MDNQESVYQQLTSLQQDMKQFHISSIKKAQWEKQQLDSLLYDTDKSDGIVKMFTSYLRESSEFQTMLVGSAIQKVLVTEKEVEQRFSSNYVSHLKSILHNFLTDKEVFKYVINDAISNWQTFDQKSLAEFLVFDIFKEFDFKPMSESRDKLFNKYEKLKIIVHYDIQNLIEKDLIGQHANKSFTSYMLNCLINKPETRKDVIKALGEFYDEIDFDILEKMEFEVNHSPSESKKKRRNAFHRRNRVRRKTTEIEKTPKDSEDFDVDAIRKSSYTAAIEIIERRRKRYSHKIISQSPLKKRTKSTEKVYIPQTLPKIKNRCSSKGPLRDFKLFNIQKQDSAKITEKINDFDSERGIEYLVSMIPMEIRILCKVIYNTLKNNKKDIEFNSDNDFLEILGNFLYYNWLIFVLFIQPHIYGLLRNNDIHALLKAMTHRIKGNPILLPELFNEMPNFPYNIQEEDLGFRFIKSIININIPIDENDPEDNQSLPVSINLVSESVLYKLKRTLDQAYALSQEESKEEEKMSFKLSLSLKNSITGLQYFEKQDSFYSRYLAKQSLLTRNSHSDTEEDLEEVLSQEMRLTVYKSKSKKQYKVSKKLVSKIEDSSPYSSYLEAFDSSSDYQRVMTAISDNYVLLVKEIAGKEEIGVKKIVNQVARRIKVLAKQDQTEEVQKEMRKYTLQKLLVQILLDGPDLRFLPFCEPEHTQNQLGTPNSNKQENLSEILNFIIRKCTSKDQETTMLTLISILKSLLTPTTKTTPLKPLLQEIHEQNLTTMQKDDALLYKINDLQGYCRKGIFEASIQDIESTKQNWKRIEFFKELEVNICIEYWVKYRGRHHGSPSMIKIKESSECSICQKKEHEESMKGGKGSKFGFTNLFWSLSPTRKEESKLDTEDTDEDSFKQTHHKHFRCYSIDEFFRIFRTLPIYESLGCTEELQTSYSDFLNIIKSLIKSNSDLDLEPNLKAINEYWVHKYLKFSDIEEEFPGEDDVKFNAKLQELRLTGYSSKLEVPCFKKECDLFTKSCWANQFKECISAIESLHSLNAPTKKLDRFLKILDSISKSFVFLTNKTDDQASVDDILHLLCYIILSSNATNLICDLRYIQTFYYFTEDQKYGKTSFCLKNLEIAIEYLKTAGIEKDDDDFELKEE
ncbi:unnamed protein product [Moneuplotes crassus]|uniref:VPS9 domain-containing protein n=1 Tax=Euplotes crassus TaxID=5936 RepID=A0AAD1U302_EUPCR|nr:unnamed protein product [Moneuplotes crassus]